MILAYLLLLTGLTISAVAIYYSVVGLAAIFSAAVIPIIIMGSALEVGKLVCASWLKANWERAPRFMKYYMIVAVAVLMLITSMGIFGFLSKAHIEQNLEITTGNADQVEIVQTKIDSEQAVIDDLNKQISQIDAAVTADTACCGFDDGILNYNDTLQKRTRIWGDLNDDAIGMIQRMTEPDIGYYASKMKLVDYADVII